VCSHRMATLSSRHGGHVALLLASFVIHKRLLYQARTCMCWTTLACKCLNRCALVQDDVQSCAMLCCEHAHRQHLMFSHYACTLAWSQVHILVTQWWLYLHACILRLQLRVVFYRFSELNKQCICNIRTRLLCLHCWGIRSFVCQA
jgi:hypothetical protein